MPKLFLKDVIKPGKYFPRNEKGEPYEVDIGLDRIQHWAKETRRLLKNGNRVPIPYVHTDNAVPLLEKDPTPGSYNNAGYVTGVRVRKKDGMLQVKVEAASDDDAERLGKAVKDVSLRTKDQWTDGLGNEYKDCITHVAAVNHPVVLNQTNFKELKESNFSPANGLAVSLAMAAERIGTTPQDGSGIVSRPEPPKKLLESILEGLAKLGIALPDDTDEYNLADRLNTALVAVNSAHEKLEGDAERLDNPPEGSRRQQPAPLAMATDPELAFAIEIAGQDNPATKKPWTIEEIKAHVAAQEAAKPQLEMSAEHKAALNTLQVQAKQPMLQRIQSLVAHKQISPKDADELLIPMLNETEIQFSAEGQVIENTNLHRVLEVMEKATPGNAIHNQFSNSADLQNIAPSVNIGGHKFSLSDGLEVQQRPADFDPPGGNEEEQGKAGDRMAEMLKN